ncbi:hypothetical protein [Vreelandella sulfidaeris]
MNDKIEKILTSTGWTRLWVAISIVWAGFWAFIAIGGVLQGYGNLFELVQVVLLAVLVPVAVLFAGRVVRWIIRGFIS